jgi:hypothetical protein
MAAVRERGRLNPQCLAQCRKATMEAFVCPITMEVADDPVYALDGHLYSHAAIDAWLQRRGRSPLTRQPLERVYLRPVALAEQYRAFCRAAGRPCPAAIEVGVFRAPDAGSPPAASGPLENYSTMVELALLGDYMTSGAPDFLLVADDPSVATHNDSELLRMAAAGGLYPYVYAAVRGGADVHARDDFALRAATKGGYTNIVEFLLEHNADPNCGALNVAAAFGRKAIAELLLTHGADIRAEPNRHALASAAAGGHAAIVKLLLDAGADASENIALHYCSTHGDHGMVYTDATSADAYHECMRLLLHAGCPPSDTELIFCARHDFDCVDLMLRYGAPVTGRVMCAFYTDTNYPMIMHLEKKGHRLRDVLHQLSTNDLADMIKATEQPQGGYPLMELLRINGALDEWLKRTGRRCWPDPKPAASGDGSC